MEALTAASISLLTVWDMTKAISGKVMQIDGLMVVHKEGGKSGDWIREGWVDNGGWNL
jgi:cyclic pyranopterin phosphate synthase